VPQTQFLSDFRARKGIRKKQFDPLLGIDVYEQAWSTQSTHNLKQPVDELESRKQTAKERISRLEGSLRISQSSGRPSTNRRRKSRNSATNSKGPVEACWREGGVLGAGRSETTSGRTRPNHRERRESGRGESRATRHGCELIFKTPARLPKSSMRLPTPTGGSVRRTNDSRSYVSGKRSVTISKPNWRRPSIATARLSVSTMIFMTELRPRGKPMTGWPSLKRPTSDTRNLIRK